MKASSRFILEQTRMKEVKERALPFVREVLREIADGIEAISGGPPGYRSAFRKGGWEYVAELQKFREDRKKYNALIYLKRKNLYEETRIGELIRSSLTAEGWAQVLQDRIRTCNRLCLDQDRVFVTFDIPESTRKAREAFRYLLREWGFCRLQQSVWTSRKDVAEDMVRYVNFVGASKRIRVIVGRLLAVD